MDTERIERLAMDRALGELNEDAAVLLDTYLAEHPEMRARVEDMDEICTQTRAVFAGRTQEQNTDRLSARRARSHRVHWLHLGRWAAVVIVSIGVGATAGRWSRPEVAPSELTVTHVGSASTPQTRRDILDNHSEGFWQSKALALLQTTPHVTTASHTPQAGVWGKYKQFRKEPSYE